MAKQVDETTPTKHHFHLMGIFPWIGIILFLLYSLPILFGDRTGDWAEQILLNGLVYAVGWAGVGAGISHIFFGKQTSKSIGFKKSPFEFEVGFADLSFGITAVLAANFSHEYWLAIIIASGLYRIGCGVGHIIQIVKEKNFAINNTAILFIDFVVPIALFAGYIALFA